MKRLLRNQVIGGVVLGLALFAGSVDVRSQAGSPVQIELVATKSEYLDSEPIGMRVTVRNGPAAIDAHEGFFARDFHLLVDFIDPDGRVIRALTPLGSNEPGPPEAVADDFGEFRAAVPCESIDGNEFTHRVVDDMKLFYDLSKVGAWQARVVTTLETFDEAVDTERGRRCFLKGAFDEDLTNDFDPLVSNTVRFNIVRSVPIAESDIQAIARLVVVDLESEPHLSISRIQRMPVKLIRRALIPEDLQPIGRSTFGLIFDRIPALQVKLTGDDGIVRFSNIPQEAYVIVARHGPTGRTVGARIREDDLRWDRSNPLVKRLFVIRVD